MALIGELTIDLNVVANNWQILANKANAAYKKSKNQGCECAAVVKADAYGLGVKAVASALYERGCRTFFVANLIEAIELTSVLPADRTLYTLQGFESGEESRFAENDIQPVIVSRAMLMRWVDFEHPQKPACAVKVNTGMNRLGLDVDEFEVFVSDSKQVESSKAELILSHLACADEPGHPKNKQQLDCFKSLISFCEKQGSDCFRFSLANSGAICLGQDYAFDLVRPGIALYSGTLGSSPVSANLGLSNPLSLHVPIVQVRSVLASETIGYGASYILQRDSVIAIVAGGYADGIFRYLSNRGYCYYRGEKVPIVGRVSMDSFAVDLTDVGVDINDKAPHETVCVFDSVDSLLHLASCSGTISYELLTSLSHRYKRNYV